jgi:penicillin-binding protein 1A
MSGIGGGFFILKLFVKVIAIFTVLLVIIIGIGLGLSLAETVNIKNQENFIEFAPALPTKILDINGTLITEFSADEKRELVSLSELPKHLIHAVLVREDPDFYNHRGFSIKAIVRATLGQLLGKNWGGGSTITQQVAGTLYTDRTERSIKRKIKELWWAFQIERRYTKNEILEIYLNYMPMGPGTYGVETASKYFFDHSAKEVTLAEAAVLAVLLSGPSRFNPISNPNEAMNRQRFVLERMVEYGYAAKEDTDASFAEYWDNFDWTKASISAYYYREDKAPWFSEYVRRELDGLLYGTQDYYRDGYVVYTTMDLRHQEAAEKFMAEGLEKANREFSRSSGRSSFQMERTYIPIVEMLTLCFDLTDIRSTKLGQNEAKAMSRYTMTINPVVDMAALAFGVNELKDATGKGFAQLKTAAEKNVVEGALICIENETGYITAIVGGSKYDETNQLIRATQSNVQPGSTFKPLYYSAAIDSRRFTASTLIYDIPVVFHNDDGTPYIPLNFRGEWNGPVLLYYALAHSINVPSIKVLDATGFDAAIDRASVLLDITDPAVIRRTFPRVYPLGLGIISTSPIRMARAFAVFGNQGRSVTPLAIRTVEDRNGRVQFDVEKELRQRQRRMGDNIQIITPQNAYIMTKMMEKTVEIGSLRSGSEWGSKFTYKDGNGKTYRMPMAGKTGTIQNWSDAWTIGYSPYYTTAIWFGFDKPGNSLGLELTGATLAGPVWGDFMREIHKGLPLKNFVRPSSGIIDVTVCAKSGLLRTAACTEGEITLPFLAGTQPGSYCELHGSNSISQTKIPVSTTLQFNGINDDSFLNSLAMPQIPFDLLPELRNSIPDRNQSNSQNNRRSNNSNTNRNNNSRNPPQSSYILNNPFLEDDIPLYNMPANNFSPNNSTANSYTGNSQFDNSPDTAVYFEPESEYDFNNDIEYDDLPRWNPLE